MVIAIAAVAAFNVNMNLTQESNISPLALANVEALAQTSGEDVIFDCSGTRCRVCGSTLCMRGEYTCYRAVFTGYKSDTCTCPC
jgi:hypothetical protein